MSSQIPHGNVHTDFGVGVRIGATVEDMTSIPWPILRARRRGSGPWLVVVVVVAVVVVLSGQGVDLRLLQHLRAVGVGVRVSFRE